MKVMKQTEVEGIDDNILIKILVRCPASSISRFRCLSKGWNDIISTPFFHQSYHHLRKERRPKMVGYIQEHYHGRTENFPRHTSASTRILQVPCGPDTIKFTENTRNYFVNSSNGLILYNVTYDSPIACNHYLIVNPVTGKEIGLIRPLPPRLCFAALALVCEDNPLGLVPYYKVVVAGMEKRRSCMRVTTYCSKTGEWTTSTPTSTGGLRDELQRCSSSPFVVDGIIHWFTRNRLQLVVYYVENDTIQLVELPDCSACYCLKVARSSRDDDLWLCMHMPDSCSIQIWKLPRDQYDDYRSQSITIPSHAWISTPTLYTPLTPSPTPLASEWSMQGFRHKVPYVAFADATGTDLCLWNLTDSSSQYVTYYPPEDHRLRCDFTPYMEALSLSSYAL